MLSQLNELAKNYEYLIKAIAAFLPFLITLFMAYIAYQQYKLNKCKEYFEFKDKMIKDFESVTSDFNKKFVKILESKESGKGKKILELFEPLESKFEKYEDLFDKTDLNLIKESYSKLKQWFNEHETFEWKWKYIYNSFSVITDFLAIAIYSNSVYIDNSFNKTITIYQLFRIGIKKLLAFIIPIPIQILYKKHIRPVFFKLMSLYFLLKLVIIIIITLFSSNSTDKNSKIEDKNAK